MYLDVGTLIGIMIALIGSILAIAYSIYIIRLQDQHIERLSRNNYDRTRRETHMLDLLDVYDELLATGRIYVADDSDEPTVNDLAKNQEESNA